MKHFDLAFDLFPIPFNTVPVHGDILRVTENAPTLKRASTTAPKIIDRLGCWDIIAVTKVGGRTCTL
jgi:hypothetical protein